MRLLKRRKGGQDGEAEAGAPADPAASAGIDELLAEIRRLTAENRAAPDRERERRLLRLRYLAGTRLMARPLG